jgi:hypothetical protein
MNSQFNKKGLMTALSASAFALGSFAAVNAYAGGACVVCAPQADTNFCDWITPPTSLTEGEIKTNALDPVWLGCYQSKYPDQDACEDAVEDPVIIPGGLVIPLTTIYITHSWWFEGTTCAELDPPMPNLAKDVKLTATLNGTGVDLKLTTTAEPDTAGLLILRGDKLTNNGTEINVACSFASGGSPYTCTDAVVGDTYRVLEIEYDGGTIIYDEVTPK